MAQRWQLSGSRADLNVWPDSDHRFTNMATPLGDVALARTTTGSHRRWTTYVYLVTFVEDEHTVFLKTIIPSRKAAKQYLGEESDGET